MAAPLKSKITKHKQAKSLLIREECITISHHLTEENLGKVTIEGIIHTGCTVSKNKQVKYGQYIHREIYWYFDASNKTEVGTLFLGLILGWRKNELVVWFYEDNEILRCAVGNAKSHYWIISNPIPLFGSKALSDEYVKQRRKTRKQDPLEYAKYQCDVIDPTQIPQEEEKEIDMSLYFDSDGLPYLICDGIGKDLLLRYCINGEAWLRKNSVEDIGIERKLYYSNWQNMNNEKLMYQQWYNGKVLAVECDVHVARNKTLITSNDPTKHKLEFYHDDAKKFGDKDGWIDLNISPQHWWIVRE